ncbi:hypothetical protein Ancab_005925 [Ancistrocladus abbreviatus]
MGNQISEFFSSLHNLPKLNEFNISKNPTALRTVRISELEGNHLCEKPLHAFPGIAARSWGGYIVPIVIGFGVKLAVVPVIKKCLSIKPSKKCLPIKPSEVETEPENLGGDMNVAAAPLSGAGENLVFFGSAPTIFDLDDLMRTAEVLGEGWFGTAYKAVLDNGAVITVKRLRGVTIAQQRFKDKIEVVGAMDHENLLPLRAYCYGNDKKYLVYDYMPMGSLYELLHGNKGAHRMILNWEMRAIIALGAARGITYLHSQGHAVSHGNSKSSNILLTESFEAKVSEFGLRPLFELFAGHLPPEVFNPRKLSRKADIYGFGVVLLELLTGKAPADAALIEEGVDFPRWVQSMAELGRTSEVFDPDLLGYNAKQEMVQFLLLAIDCTQAAVLSRPSMPQVRKKIEEICASRVTDAEDGHTHFTNPCFSDTIDFEKESNEMMEVFQDIGEMAFSVKHGMGKKLASMAGAIDELRAKLAPVDTG